MCLSLHDVFSTIRYVNVLERFLYVFVTAIG